jgi:hypothetical protein
MHDPMLEVGMYAAETRDDRRLSPSAPPELSDAQREAWASLTRADREVVTPETLARWARDLHPDDIDLAEIAALERRRRANLRTIRQGAELSDNEWRLWRYLAKHAGHVRTFVQIAHHLYGTSDRPITPRMLRSTDGFDNIYVQAIRRYVGNLRRKLEVDPIRPQHLATVRGVGYAWYDAPPSLDDGIDYQRRSSQYARLRVDMLALLNPAALPDGGEQPDEYLDADVVDAVSVADDGEIIAGRGIRTGPEFDRLVAERDARRRGPASIGDAGSER